MLGRRRKFLILLFVAFSAFQFASAAENLSQIDTTPVDADVQRSATDVYAEYYRHPILSQNIFFSRARVNGNKVFSKIPSPLYFEADYEKQNEIGFGDLETGAQYFLGNTRLNFAISQRGLGRTDELNQYEARAGISSGIFIKHDTSPVFSEAYGEAFAIAPLKTNSFLTSNGWVKIGHRTYEKHYLILDALILELRGSINSSIPQAGPNYSVLNFGPRISVWAPRPQASVSLFLAKTHVLTSQVDASQEQYWFILSIGGIF